MKVNLNGYQIVDPRYVYKIEYILQYNMVIVKTDKAFYGVHELRGFPEITKYKGHPTLTIGAILNNPNNWQYK